jgi:hypothetical protein
MSDFTSDLNAEKLSEIETQIQELGSEVAENRGDIDRLETIELFDRSEESRQVIVHWLEDVDGDTIVSIGTAKEEFVKFSEERAEDPNEHQVSHGDVLVIGGDCPWYAICAKVDRGVGGGDVGFQAEDPMDVAGTELENDEPYKEFVVWGGCGTGDGDGGGAGDGCVGTPSSVCISTATALTSSSSGPPIKLTEIRTPVPAPNPLSTEFTFNSGLSDFTVVEDDNATPESGESFLAFEDNITANDICPDGCGVKLNLKKTEIEKKLHKINATPLEQKKVVITPKELVTKDYTSMTASLTVGNATISSDSCGNLSSSPGCDGGGESMSFGLATLTQTGPTVIEDADLIDVQDVDPANITPVSVGNLTLPTDFTQGAVNLSDIDNKKAFLPLLDGTDCPKTETVDYTASLSINISENDDDCDESGGGCKSITVSITPSIGQLVFKCGLLVNTIDPTSAGVTPTEKTFKVACGCEPECPNGASGTLSLFQFNSLVATLQASGQPLCNYSGGGYTLETDQQGNWRLITPGAVVHNSMGGGPAAHYGTDFTVQ